MKENDKMCKKLNMMTTARSQITADDILFVRQDFLISVQSYTTFTTHCI